MLFTALRNISSIPLQSSNVVGNRVDKMKHKPTEKATVTVKPVVSQSSSRNYLQSPLLLSTNRSILNSDIEKKITQQRGVPPLVPQGFLGKTCLSTLSTNLTTTSTMANIQIPPPVLQSAIRKTSINLFSNMNKTTSEKEIFQQQKNPPVPMKDPIPIGKYF